MEIQAPDGSTSQVNVPSLGALGVFTADVSWTVPANQNIGDVLIQFVVDPSQSVTADADRSNNQGTFSMFVGRLPTASIDPVIPKLTFDNVVVDAAQSSVCSITNWKTERLNPSYQPIVYWRIIGKTMANIWSI